MKRKTILSFITGLFLLGGLSSCMDLDETVYDKLPADDFGQSTAELNALIGNSHNTMKKFWTEYMHLSECSGSMAVTPTRRGGDWYDGGQYREIYMHTWTSQTSRVKSAWKAATEAIGTCNEAIRKLQNSEILTEEEKAQDVADLRGVRAFWIYVMMDYWGNIPLLTEFHPTDKVFPGNSSRQEVFDWLIQEVEEIKDICPPATTENYGSFTQGAAYSLLAKLYLNAEAWGVTFSGNAYQKVIDNCDKVMAMGYILEPNWKDNFSVTNENSKEAILAATFSSSDTGNDGNVKNELHNNTLHYKDYLSLGITASGTWNGICAQPEYVRLFDEEDARLDGTFLTGLMIDKSTGKPIMTDHNNELNHTIDVNMIPGMEYDGTNWSAVEQHDGARCFKWEFASDLTSSMGNDFHIFRLADIYLMKAEALVRKGGTDSWQAAIDLLNKIRKRSELPELTPNFSETSELEMLQLVLHERDMELAAEGKRWYDLVRLGKQQNYKYKADFISIVIENNKTVGSKWINSVLSNEHAWFLPIPEDDINTNKYLEQNPYYDVIK